MLSDVPTVLAASATDWVERATPPVLLVLALIVWALRRRERRRGPDADEL